MVVFGNQQMTTFNTISVIGLGYIGLPTAAAFATAGCRVLGVDINADTVNTINQGKIHIIEPDLDQAVQQAVEKGLLSASVSIQPADAFLIAVPTPFKIITSRI
ncbi:UDP-N-acetyl-D-mannosamine dehydrogenase [Actinobacillus equuli]|nr:UDP-N-acetyl-D-mannosamine dehydrogenase [Actinobacillus equuli]